MTAKPAKEDGSPPKAIRPATAFGGTFAVTAVNPKTIIFFVAFTPQFMSPALDYWTQAGILLVTFCVVVTLSDGFYALTASWVAGFLKGPSVLLSVSAGRRGRPDACRRSDGDDECMRLTGARASSNAHSASWSGPIV